MIGYPKKSSEWEIYLLIKPKFMSSTAANEKRKMYSKSENRIIMIGNDTNKIIQELFDLVSHKYHIVLKLIFGYVLGMHYICDKINLSRGGLYVDYQKWIKNKKKQ